MEKFQENLHGKNFEEMKTTGKKVNDDDRKFLKNTGQMKWIW